jgi:O-antigen/teichoic acid export membrane protein
MERSPAHEESEEARSERQLGELLSELRIAMPGVQLLFAFLLVVPFNQRFARVSDFERDLYLVVLLCAAFASVLLIAPTAYHRIMFHRGDRPRLIRTATRMALGGLALLALAMSGAVLLVTDFLFGSATAAVCAALVLAAFAWFWFGLALSRRARGPSPRP